MNSIHTKDSLGTTTQHSLEQGLYLHQQGHIDEAMRCYQDVLHTHPHHPDALCYMGVIAHQTGNNSYALELLDRVLQDTPHHVDALMHKALVLDNESKHSEALQIIDHAIAQQQEAATLWFHKGNILSHATHHAEALVALNHAIHLNPDMAEAYWHMGHCLRAMGRGSEAETAYRMALTKAPHDIRIIVSYASLIAELGRQNDAIAHLTALADIPDVEHRHEVVHMLARILGSQSEWQRATPYFEEAAALNPHSFEYLNTLATAYAAQGLIEESKTRFLDALALIPDTAESAIKRMQVVHSIAELYRNSAKHGVALQYIQQEIAIAETHQVAPALCTDAYMNAGNAYLALGDATSAITYFRKAFESDPTHYIVHSNYLFALHYAPEVTGEDIMRETIAWAEAHTSHITPYTHTDHDRTAERRLKIGYVSSDFRDHPVNVYVEPILTSHDQSTFEVYCYNSNFFRDETTQRLQHKVSQWRDIAGLNDAEAAALIHADGIDILIDLSGHTAGARLQVFAYKPAPLQATWIGYFNTTGIKAIDYIITDRFLLPPEEEYLYTEKPLRLPTTGACYQLRNHDIKVGTLPALRNGHITFGCFSAVAKVTPETMALWVEILRKLPTAKLMVKGAGFMESDVQHRYRELCIKGGANPDQLVFTPHESLHAYLEAYNNVDIMLDTFPYNAATTTVDALWMGVPLITRKGNKLLGHIGESMLGAVGLEQFIANSKEEYIEKAVSVAQNTQMLSTIREGLRARLEQSPMTNPLEFTQGLEAVWRNTWKEWCKNQMAS